MKIRISPSGVHLFNRISGLNILLDELSFPQSLWSAAPRQVSIALTNICDLKCSYCFAPKNKATLDYNTLAQWIEELDQHGCLGVGFGGGEPTLYPKLIDLCRYTTKNTNLAVTLTTHAHKLNNKLASALFGNVHYIRISMDGVGSTYEALRNRSFSKFKQKLLIAKEIAPFGINYVVNSVTISDLDTATSFAADIGASEFLLLPEQPTPNNKGINEITTIALQSWVKRYNGNVPLTISEFGAEGLPTCNPFMEEKGMDSYLHIDACGTLKRSSFSSEGIIIDRDGVIKAIDKLRKL
jgi:MoaA/NifB/PqqE/SkfB family radical SAM enzyme